jgi:uncharacterized delta-60 repeat protein
MLKRLAAAALCLCLLAVCVAQATDWTDRGFRGEGFVKEPLGPAVDTGPVGPNIWDLAAAPGGFVGSLADLSKRQDYFGAVRYRHNGSLARGFGRSGFTKQLELRGTSQAQGIAVQPDGRILVAGYRSLRGPRAALLARYRPDGSLDRSFGRKGVVIRKPSFRLGNELLHDVAVQPGGRILAVGGRGERGIGLSGGRPSGFVVAYRPDGSVDRSFGRNGRVIFPAPGGNGEYTSLMSIEQLADGRLLVAGYHFGSLFLARLLPDGRLDRSFGGGSGKVVMFVGDRHLGCTSFCWSTAPFAIRPDGRIVVLASVYPDVPVLLRLHPDGRLDRGFGRNGMVKVRVRRHYLVPFDLALQGDRIVVVGWDEFSRKDAVVRFSVLRYLANGRLDHGFGYRGLVVRRSGEFSGAYATLNQGRGRVVVAGGGQSRAKGDRWSTSFLLLTRYLPG